MDYVTLRTIINKYDPIGLFPACGVDEYDIEINEILSYLNTVENCNLGDRIYNTFSFWFGCNIGDKIVYQKIADEIIAGGKKMNYKSIYQYQQQCCL